MEVRNRVVGVKQSLKAIRQGRAERVYLAEDADFFVSVPIIDACKECGVKLEFVESKSALGRKCHIDVASAVAVELKNQAAE